MEQEKFSWKEMTWKQRWQYFMDYYFKITLVIVIAAGLVISFIKTVFFDKTETMVSMMVVDESIYMELDRAEEELKEKMGWTEKYQAAPFTLMSTGNYQTEVAIFTRLQAASVDVMICDRETFDTYTGYGYFDEAEKYIPEGMDLSDTFITGCISERDDMGEVVGYGEELVYGFDLSGSEKYKELGGTLENPVLAVTANGEHRDMAASVIAYFFE